MKKENEFDVIIIGGSYAGLSAAMTLGRSLRKVLIIDAGKPCNRQTPHSHNFITQDGEKPAEIAAKALEQVLQYTTIQLINGFVISAEKAENKFLVQTENNESFIADKLLFATGVKDIMPKIKGFAECWGVSVLHCPYCHGYEVKNLKIGVVGNGDMGFEYAKLISNWTKNLTLFTNGKSQLSLEQTEKLKAHNTQIVESELAEIEHENGYINQLKLSNGSTFALEALFCRVPFTQNTKIPEKFGCELTENGHIKVDEFQKTTVLGIFAAGDNTILFRTVSAAVAAGTKAGAIINHELITERF